MERAEECRVKRIRKSFARRKLSASLTRNISKANRVSRELRDYDESLITMENEVVNIRTIRSQRDDKTSGRVPAFSMKRYFNPLAPNMTLRHFYESECMHGTGLSLFVKATKYHREVNFAMKYAAGTA